MADITYKLGTVNINIRDEVENTDVALDTDITFYKENVVYTTDLVGLDNAGVAKFSYDSTTDTFLIGYVKRVEKDPSGSIVSTDYLPVRVARSSGSGDGPTGGSSETVVESSNISFNDKQSIGFSSELEKLLAVKYSDTVVEGFKPNLSSSSSSDVSSFAYQSEENNVRYNVLRVKKANVNYTLSTPVYVKVFKITSINKLHKDILTVSNEAINVSTTTSSSGYFEWTFKDDIYISEGDYLFFIFSTSQDGEDEIEDRCIIKTFIGTDVLKTGFIFNNTSFNNRLDNFVDFKMGYKEPLSIYFK